VSGIPIRVLLLHGPNLNLLGTREPDVYGTLTLDELNRRVDEAAQKAGAEVRPFQSNHEGALIDALHEARTWADGVVINPGAYGHTSYALRDAFAAVGLPAIEVHLTNIQAREAFRHHSVISPVMMGTMSGLGWRGYVHAVLALVDMLREAKGSLRA
jgi:3-dehydroquinate dehydratase-2